MAFVIFMLLCMIILASCKGTPSQSTLEPFSAGELTPYYTATASPTVTATPVDAPTATPQPTLTPTPRTYISKDSDTLWTIAAKAGLTLTELVAANPDIDPYNLRGGTTIILPAPRGASGTQTVPTPTAIGVNLGSPDCTPSLTGGLYCFVTAENSQTFDIQNLVVQFILTDPDSSDKFIQDGLLPLNRLSSGSSLPLFTYFAPPIPVSPKIEIRLLSALPVSENDSKFLDLAIENPQTVISTDGYSASVQGRVGLSDQAESASRYWLAAVAYDAMGKVVAVRQLDREKVLAGGELQDFTMYVYSIAGKIDHVDVFGDATK